MQSHVRLVATALLLALFATPGTVTAQELPRQDLAGRAADEPVWITLGADAFDVAQSLFPPGALRESLAALDQADGVVLTRIPRSMIPELSERIHDELLRCGGFFAHESEAEARAAMERVRNPPRPLGALSFEIDRPQLVAEVAGGVDEAELLATVTALSTNFPNRYHAHHAVHHSADWIRDLWAGYAAGRPDVTVQLYSHGGITPQPSVVLTIPGTTLADEVVILGAHQDSTAGGCFSNPNCSAPGADDDATGIAALSEVIRAAMEAGFQPQRTVQLMGYAAEEVGLEGSEDLAEDYAAAGTNVVAVMQLDMTGYHGSSEDILMLTSHTDPELTDFVELLIDTYFPNVVRGTTACPYACSDHASWHSLGFRTAFPFEARFNQYNSAIHSTNDTVATLGDSAAHAIKFARLAAAFMVETSVDGTPDIFADGFESGDTTAWTSSAP